MPPAVRDATAGLARADGRGPNRDGVTRLPALRWLTGMLVATIAIAGGAATPREAPPNEAAGNVGGTWVHAYAAYGEPKYPPGFAHFDYVNPDAPKGGTLKLQQPGPAHELRQVQPVHRSRAIPAGADASSCSRRSP